GVPPGISTDAARLLFGQGTAHLAELNPLPCGQDRVGQLPDDVCLHLDDMKRDPFRRSGPDAGEFVQGRDEGGNGLGVGRHDVVKTLKGWRVKRRWVSKKW